MRGMEHPLRTWRRAQQPKLQLWRMAELVQSSEARLSKLERWEAEPSVALLRRLMAFTGLTADQILMPRPKGRSPRRARNPEDDKVLA
jgi:hypothetical protein